MRYSRRLLPSQRAHASFRHRGDPAARNEKRSTTMKNWIATTALALLPLASLAQPAAASCNLATLNGPYSYNFNGFLIDGSTATNLAVVGTIIFDGAGKISGFDTSVVGG